MKSKEQSTGQIKTFNNSLTFQHIDRPNLVDLIEADINGRTFVHFDFYILKNVHFSYCTFKNDNFDNFNFNFKK